MQNDPPSCQLPCFAQPRRKPPLSRTQNKPLNSVQPITFFAFSTVPHPVSHPLIGLDFVRNRAAVSVPLL